VEEEISGILVLDPVRLFTLNRGFAGIFTEARQQDGL
jgi:hypothetical protein